MRISLKDLLREGKLIVAIIGLGRIGLPTAVVFAEEGANVIGVDINPSVVEEVNRGETRFIDELNLKEPLLKVVNSGKLKALSNASEAAAKAHVTIICVPTPLTENKVPNYTAILSATREVARGIRRESLFIVESTVGPGDVEDLIIPELEANSGLKAGVDIHVASCPERADPGRVMECLRTVARIVGGLTERCTERAAELYEAIFKVKVVKVSSPKVANAVKITENVFRDVNIALMNELAMLYEKLGIDIYEVIEACSTKWNFIPHYPGPGVGGPCLPANPYYLIHRGIKVDFTPYIVRIAREVNDRMPEYVVHQVSRGLNIAGKSIKGSRIAVLGLSYKPNVKDFQQSPSIRIIKDLVKQGAYVKVYDPFYSEVEVLQILGMECSSSLEEALRKADCIIFTTAHHSFKQIDLTHIANITAKPTVLIDVAGVFRNVKILSSIIFLGVGRSNVL